MRPGVRTLFFVPLLFLMFMTADAQAQAYYTAANGNDSNPGTISLPFRTIKKGIGVLSAGATLYIRSGTYAESINSPSSDFVPSGTSWAAPVTIAAYPGDRVIMRPSAGDNVIALTTAAHRYIVFDGLILDAVNTSFTPTNWGNGVFLGGANYVRFKNTEILNAPGQGILTGGTHHEFLNLVVHDNGRVKHLTHGIYLLGNDNLVEGCLIYNNAAWGMQIYGGGSNNNNRNVVRRNKFYNNNRMADNGGGLDISGGDGNLVYNNVFWGHNQYSIYVAWATPTNTKVFNNTTVGGAGIFVNSDSSGALVQNNIVNGSNATIDNHGDGTVVTNNLFTDPKFMDVAASDFRLRLGSPAIDAGLYLADVSVDFDNNQRLGVYDIGAYEYGSSSGTPPPTPGNVRIR